MHRDRIVAGLDVNKDGFLCIMHNDVAIIFEKTYGTLFAKVMIFSGIPKKHLIRCGARIEKAKAFPQD